MRRTSKWLALLVMTVMVGTAPALTVSSSLAGFDWFDYSGNVNSGEWRSDMVTTAHRSEVGINDGDPGSPGANGDETDVTYPGWGGQDYDAEQIFYFFDGTVDGGFLNIALVTGFNPFGEDSGIASPTEFLGGDLFIDLGGDAAGDELASELAVSWTQGEARSGKAWANAGWSLIDPFYDGSPDPDNAQFTSPYRIDETSGAIELASSLVGVGFQQLDSNGNPENERWLYEVRLELDGADFDVASLFPDAQGQGGGIGLHWTMECGNDLVDVQDDTPFAPIPEPSTMVLLGLGVVGMAMRARRPAC